MTATGLVAGCRDSSDSESSSIHAVHGRVDGGLVRVGVLVTPRDGLVVLGVVVLLVHLDGPEWHTGDG